MNWLLKAVRNYFFPPRTPREPPIAQPSVRIETGRPGGFAPHHEKRAFRLVEDAEPGDQDLDEWSSYGRDLKVRKPVSVVIKYKNTEGISVRKVDVEWISASTHKDKTMTLVHFTGFCHLRNGTRTFYFRSVQAAADPATGTLIDHLGSYVVTKMGRTNPVRRSGH